jgi:hypothetical protein
MVGLPILRGLVAFVAAGGNPDGYLEETDTSSGGNGNMHVSAPANFSEI